MKTRHILILVFGPGFIITERYVFPTECFKRCVSLGQRHISKTDDRLAPLYWLWKVQIVIYSQCRSLSAPCQLYYLFSSISTLFSRQYTPKCKSNRHFSLSKPRRINPHIKGLAKWLSKSHEDYFVEMSPRKN